MTEHKAIENILHSILEEYAKGQILSESLDNTRENYKEELNNIKEGYGLNKKNDKIKAYGGYRIKKNINEKIQGVRRYDYDVITHEDKEGKLLNCVADYLLASDDHTRQLFAYEILRTIVNNITKYFADDFTEKVDKYKISYEQYGNFDYMES